METISENVHTKGEWRGWLLSPHVQESDHVVGRLRAIARGMMPQDTARKYLARLKRQGVVLGEIDKPNLVPTVGRNILARLLTDGTGTPVGKVNYIALGTGTTAFTNASLTLNTETFRKLVSSASHDSNIAYLDVFIASGDVADQTFKEAGAFINGTAGTSTGSPFSLVVQDFTKSGSMFISLRITFT